MHYQYRTTGTCSKLIDFDLQDGVVTNVVFTGGCSGNLKAIGHVVDGWTVDKIVETFQGITCGMKPTSCSDQLTRAVRAAQQEAARQQGSLIV